MVYIVGALEQLNLAKTELKVLVTWHCEFEFHRCNSSFDFFSSLVSYQSIFQRLVENQPDEDQTVELMKLKEKLDI